MLLSMEMLSMFKLLQVFESRHFLDQLLPSSSKIEMNEIA